ncbi:MAG: MerR family transcriptional regulator [Bacteroidota bacterium]|nr:MerR family transcriptional regulator [Bacteroidota bacterium]
MITYSIKDVEKLTGIKAHTIRIWEKRYNIVCPSRTNTNIRFYNDGDLKRLLNISILNRNGYKISNIVRLSGEEINNNILEASTGPANFESQIENLIVAMIDLDENKFEKSISNSILRLGFEEAVADVIFPFMEKIGLLWQIGTICPAHEHFITNLIRQKFIIALDAENRSPLPHCKTFLLFLPEGEMHELSLLFYSFLIKKRGHHVIYLGQNLPVEYLQQAILISHPDFLVTTLTSAITNYELVAFIKALSEQFPYQTIIIGGHQVTALTDLHLKNVFAMKRKSDLENILLNID